MNVRQVNECLLHGRIEERGLFPHLEALARSPFVFEVDFGLEELPAESGVLLIRGPRQYGKSTWLEGEVRRTIERFGPASAYYLNGDELTNADDLVAQVRAAAGLFRDDAAVHRLFVDEITAVSGWERGLKRLLDSGELRSVLVVTTGSRATDLRRGAERLPGRKGRLARTTYLFTPLSLAAFERAGGERLGSDAPLAYLLSGGCPVAASEILATGSLPEHVIEMVRDWVLGECARSGRDRASLLAVWETILARGGTPIGQACLARESGLANNTVAAGYVELLADLMCIGIAHAWDADRRVAVRRKPAKYPPINLLAAVAFDRSRLRSPADFHALPPTVQGRWWEWCLAQEIWRRAARRGELLPEVLHYWQGGEREIDYVVRPDLLIEVKRGGASPLELAWFGKSFPKASLWVAGGERFQAGPITGRPIAELLRDESW